MVAVVIICADVATAKTKTGRSDQPNHSFPGIYIEREMKMTGRRFSTAASQEFRFFALPAPSAYTARRCAKLGYWQGGYG
jgi:hypothetical protein